MRRLFQRIDRHSAEDRLHDAGRPAVAWRVFLILALALLPLMVLASVDFGVTWDERARHYYGERILQYYQGLRTRESFDVDGGSPYGGLFDFLCAWLEQRVPIERYMLRHMINAVFGWVGVLYAGRLAARLFGRWAAVLAMVLLASAPRYFADSMNNPKDLPFAAMTVAALYYFSTVSRTWPYFSWSMAVKIAIALALALNIRAGALLYLGYFGLLIAGYVVAERNWRWRRLADTATRVAVVSLATLLLGTVFWPWAQGAPLTRPIQALIGFANYDWAGVILFKGKNVAATNLPWDYVPWWFLISTPPVVLIGAVLSLAALRRRGWTAPVLLLWSVALLPVVVIIARHSTLYDGIRHVLFITPVVIVLASAGWIACLTWRTRPWLPVGTALLLALGLVEVLASDIRYHPNQGVYFNALVGGPRGALGRYDLDYWGNCLLQAVEWSARTARQAGAPIAISGNPWHLIQLDAIRYKQVYFVLPSRPYELDIRLNRGPVEGVTGLAAVQNALYRVETPDGALLCVVLPGPAFDRVRSRLPSDLLSRSHP